VVTKSGADTQGGWQGLNLKQSTRAAEVEKFWFL